MNFQDRLADILRRMQEARLDLVIGLHDGAHFIEKPNPVMVLSGFKSLGPAASLLHADGRLTTVVTPAWDAERVGDVNAGIGIGALGADDIVAGIQDALGGAVPMSTGIAGFRVLPSRIADRIAAGFPNAVAADKLVFDAARTKTNEEIADARAAARIAERGYQHLLAVAHPNMSEDDLAVELKWHMKSLGADDNFLLLCAAPHNRASRPTQRDCRRDPLQSRTTASPVRSSRSAPGERHERCRHQTSDVLRRFIR
jgi:Xaa-Pro aminopeptidase